MPETNQLYNDKELFLQIKEGNEEAFASLFYHYIPEVSPVVFNIVRSEAVVKDIIQDVFLNIWLSRDKLDEIELTRNWIFKIAYNQSYKWLRSQGMQQKASQLLAANHPYETGVNATEEHSSFAATVRHLRAAVHQLPPQMQKIYLLSRENNLKNDEIANLLQLSPQTVKNTLSRALASIKDYLARQDVHLPAVLLTFMINLKK